MRRWRERGAERAVPAWLAENGIPVFRKRTCVNTRIDDDSASTSGAPASGTSGDHRDATCQPRDSMSNLRGYALGGLKRGAFDRASPLVAETYMPAVRT